MKEFVEKLVEKLEKYKNTELLREDYEDENGMFNDCEEAYADGESNGRYQMCVRMLNFVNQLAEEYKHKYVSIEVYKQVAGERDIAIEQLHELGYEFGQKIN